MVEIVNGMKYRPTFIVTRVTTYVRISGQTSAYV